MHKNTAILIVFLSVIVALIVGLNLGHIFSKDQQEINNQPSTSPISLSSPISTSTTYTHPACKVTFAYDPSFSISSESSDSAVLINKNTREKITLLCGVEFPKPPLPEDKIEVATIAGQMTTVYHDASAKDGTPVDVAVFIHPKTDMEVALFGFGEKFQKLLTTLKFQ